MSDWRPINTAPKDRPVDLFTERRRVFPNCTWFQATEGYGYWVDPYAHVGQSGWPAGVENPTYWRLYEEPYEKPSE